MSGPSSDNGSFVVWGFRAETRQAWGNAPFVAAHLTGKNERVPAEGGGTVERDTGWPVFWDALDLLIALGLVEFVGHVVNADTDEGTVLHPYAMGNGEPGERTLCDAAHLAGHAMLNDVRSAEALAGKLWLLPARNHLREVQLVGLARLKYRARTMVTAAWLSSGAEWSDWARRYDTAAAEATGRPLVDINDVSTRSQRAINGTSTGGQR